MCLNPIKVRNNSVYKSATFPFAYEVPCGHCDECRDSLQREWRTRLCHEINHCIKQDGVGVFLLFTYNNRRLPRYTDGNFSIVSFRQEDIRKFLNRLKTRVFRKFGEHAKYRYFICSEYGETTCRPHYHVQFLLNSFLASQYVEFIELCRELWSDTFERNGFVFPRRCAGRYVDNFGRSVDPRVQSAAGSAFYVSKYITKDLSYYRIPELVEYLSDPVHRFRMRYYLPKHWQSQGIGRCIFQCLDFSNDVKVANFLSKGLYNPVTCRTDSMPRYVLDKLIYRKVRTDRTECPRTYLNDKGKLCYRYDRELTEFGRKWLGFIYDKRVSEQTEKIYNVLFNLKTLSPDVYGIHIHNRYANTPIDIDLCYRISVYHNSLKFISDEVLDSILSNSCGDFDSLIPAARSLWIDRHDTAKYRALSACGVTRVPSCYDYDKRNHIIPELCYYEWLYCHVSRIIRGNKLAADIANTKKLDALKRELCSKFDINLC